jgi:hypothetical protein
MTKARMTPSNTPVPRVALEVIFDTVQGVDPSTTAPGEHPVNTVLWIVAGLLALVMLGSGGMKIVRPTQALRPSMGWIDDFPSGSHKIIGTLEVLAALGLILPPALGIAAILAPIAATGLAIIMIGALLVHVRRRETQPLPIVVILLLLSVFVAWGRFGPYSF